MKRIVLTLSFLFRFNHWKRSFIGYMLVYIGANVLNGKVLLWKNNDKLKIITTGERDYYLDKNDLDSSFVDKIDKYLDI